MDAVMPIVQERRYQIYPKHPLWWTKMKIPDVVRYAEAWVYALLATSGIFHIC
jgi:hypothetical protein